MRLKEGFLKQLLFVLVGIFVLWLAVHYWDGAVHTVKSLVGAASPLLLGLIIAYVVNIIMIFWETTVFGKVRKEWAKKIRRPLCMILGYVSIIGVILILLQIIFPKIVDCLTLLANQIPKLIREFRIPEDYSFVMDLIYQPDVQNFLKNVANRLFEISGGAINGIVSGVGSVVSTLFTLLIAVIFSIYLLLGKERLLGQCNRLIDLYLPKKIVEKVRFVVNIANESFRKFIVGQCLEAVIIGTLCALGMLLLRMPYAVMIGCLIGVTALIPFVGAYIGATAGALMIVTVSPWQALGFLVYLVILQQLEDNLIYPRVVGNSIGLPGIWVLAAITIGGGFGGVLGMMVGVPLMSVIYQLVKINMDKRNSEKAVIKG